MVDWDTGLYIDSSLVTICDNGPNKNLEQFSLYPNYPNPLNSQGEQESKEI